MAHRTVETGSIRNARRVAMGALAIVLLATVALAQPGATAQAEARESAQSDNGREVALLVPRRIRLIINYHKPREA
ncbi:MAG: hypothetical protein ACF8QF_14050 [Phycisphaerales bacterium]